MKILVVILIGITLIIGAVVSSPIEQQNESDISPVMSPLKLRRSIKYFSSQSFYNKSQEISTTVLPQKNEAQQVSSTNSLNLEESIRLLEQILPTNEYPREPKNYETIIEKEESSIKHLSKKPYDNKIQLSLRSSKVPEESLRLLEQILPTNEYPPGRRDENY